MGQLEDQLEKDIAYLCHQIGGSFSAIDVNPKDDKITGKEFGQVFRRQLREHPEIFTPTKIRYIDESAQNVFNNGYVITKEKWLEVRTWGSVVARIAKNFEPELDVVKNAARSLYDTAAPLARNFLENMLATIPGEENVSSLEQIQRMANRDGMITRKSAYDNGVARAKRLYPDMPADELQKNVSLYVEVIFGEGKSLDVTSYKRNLDSIKPEVLEAQKDVVPPPGLIKRAQPVPSKKVDPEISERLKQEATKAMRKLRGGSSSIEVEPVNPIALEQVLNGKERA